MKEVMGLTELYWGLALLGLVLFILSKRFIAKGSDSMGRMINGLIALVLSTITFLATLAAISLYIIFQDVQ